MAQKQDTRTQLLTASPLQLMISLSVPATIGMVVVGLYNFMDRVFVGQLINEVAMGAVSVAYPFTLINSGISTLIGVGSASVLSRAVGKKDQDTIDKIMGNLAAMNLILGIIVTAVGMIFTRQLLTLSGAEGEILNNAERYLRIIFAGSLFVNFAQSSNMIMRGEGLLKQAMVFSGGSAILNIILDPILISVLNPYGMGIDGAAYATIISQIVYAVAMLRHFICKSKNVRFHGVRIEKALVSEILGATVLSLVFYIPIELAPGTVLSWFIKDTSTVSMGVTDFRFMFSSYVLIGFLLMVITLMQSLGKASKASALVLLRQIVLFVPLAFILPNIGGLGINGVFFAPPLTDLVVVVIAALMLISEFRNMTKLAAQEK
ncbi:hypothetical protein ADH76_07550 [Enterocloster clostridioformis]|uniref:MATE family efflux transporter n=3 Tax=Enterocloster clostridioformis TaxID=1531 RepID=UPI00080C543E|nr:MATE family efflux transporter [Enterocloster clostridioformis]ANU49794.1 hypothetical protein A4V08_32190 [Lachnoclostridium sp. YL32]NDO28725.1 hypothetical protein [Enterocloster clostridioformis]OXE71148.1 hypothetical protein ADH76_07550 [Enterocloster clostridioformis]QQR01301.1 polysaccharide biosynthesis C-terminal domain-containing protein [Enterocloster clostridioformis]